VIALEDGALAIVLIAASRLADESARVALLERFAATADPPRPRATARPISPAAIKMRRHRERDRRGEAVYRVPIGPEVVDLLVKTGWLPADREVFSDLEVAEAAGAILRDTARRVTR
jgi:hypothetical protein